MLINKTEDTSNNNMYRNSAFIVNVHLTVVNRIACNRTWVRAPVLVGFVLPDMCNVLKLVVFPFVLFWPLCCLVRLRFTDYNYSWYLQTFLASYQRL